MADRTLTTASFLFSYGWARFMGAGFFGMEKTRGMTFHESGTQTMETRIIMARTVCNNVIGFLEGDRPVSRVLRP